jgi:hypothetical protein
MVQTLPANNQFLLGAWKAMSDVAHALLAVADCLYALLPRRAGLHDHQAILAGLCWRRGGDPNGALRPRTFIQGLTRCGLQL